MPVCRGNGVRGALGVGFLCRLGHVDHGPMGANCPGTHRYSVV